MKLLTRPCMYVVMLSDPARSADTVIGYLHQKADARRYVSQANARVIAERGLPVPGQPRPLYYVVRRGR